MDRPSSWNSQERLDLKEHDDLMTEGLIKLRFQFLTE